MNGIPAWAVKEAKVVCVDGAYIPDTGKGDETMPDEGAVYTIREVVRPDGETPCVYLDEITNPVGDYFFGRYEYAFRLTRFRPLVIRTQEQDVAMFARLLDHVPEVA